MSKNLKEFADSLVRGTRVRLVSMKSDPDPIPVGMEGTVRGMDDAGSLLVRWDNGRTLSLLPDADEYAITGCILAAKVYGREGHRQRESFSPSVKYDWSKMEGMRRKLGVLNYDITGTHEYSICVVECALPTLCVKELYGQLTDGTYENSYVSKTVECEVPEEYYTMPLDGQEHIFVLDVLNVFKNFLEEKTASVERRKLLDIRSDIYKATEGSFGKDRKTISEEDRCAFIGSIVEIFEDLLEKEGISFPEEKALMLEAGYSREEADKNHAVLFGADYDKVAGPVEVLCFEYGIFQKEA